MNEELERNKPVIIMNETDYEKLCKLMDKNPGDTFATVLDCINVVPDAETKKITEKDMRNFEKDMRNFEKDMRDFENALSVVAKFKNKLDRVIEHYKKEINDDKQLLKVIEAEIAHNEYIIKNYETLPECKILSREPKYWIIERWKDYKKQKKTMKKTISKLEKELELCNRLYNNYKEIFLK